ncbi:MAG: cobalamin-dependent protein [Opitutales bacterium]|nr:cobalamin-dependent protein [Opitutales bacterium]
MVNLNDVADPFPVFPLGLAYVCDALRAAGHAVSVHDLLVTPGADAFAAALSGFAPEVVGFSLRNIDNVRADAAQSYVGELRAWVERVRTLAPGAKIVFGGAGFSIFAREILSLTGADFGVCGEGERAFPALLEALAGGKAVAAAEGLPGGVLARLANGEIAEGSAPPREETTVPPFDPDSAWVDAYRARGAIFNTQTQRGCPLKCSYCTYPLIEGRTTRPRPPERVVAEMRCWRERGVRYVFLVDSVFNTTPAHLRALGQALTEARLDMEWGCFLRPRGFTADDLAALRGAGLRHIEFGSDSFSDEMLRGYGKSFTYGHIEEASALAEAAGINYAHFLILGGPGETEATLEETFQRARALAGGVFFAFPGVRVYPGTPVWARLRERGLALPDNLLSPFFFVEEGLSAEGLTARLTAEAETDARWVPPDFPARFGAMTARFRRKGIEGPLWEYFPLMRRFS